MKTKSDYQRPRKCNAYKRKVKYKQYLKRLAKEGCDYPSPAVPVDCNGDYTDDPDDVKYIRREYRGRMSKFLKKIGNRKIRRYNGDISSGCEYKRLFDFWWELT